MAGKLTMSRKALAALLDAFPGLDDVGPYGPSSPGVGAKRDWASLSPQPLAPREARVSAPGLPVRWRAIGSARSVIRSMLAVHQIAAAAPKSELAREMIANARTALSGYVEDYCGMRWPH